MERPYMRPFLSAYVNHNGSMKQSDRSLPPRMENAEPLRYELSNSEIGRSRTHSEVSHTGLAALSEDSPTTMSHFLVEDLIRLLTGQNYGELEMEIRVFLLLTPVVIGSNQFAMLLSSLSPSAGVRHMMSLWRTYYEGHHSNAERSRRIPTSKIAACSMILEAYPEDLDQRLWLNHWLDSASKKSLAKSPRLPQVPGVPKSSSLNGLHFSKFPGQSYHQPFDLWLNNGSQDISDQLTLFWFGIFKNISVFELVNYALSRNSRDRRASPFVTRFVETSQELMTQVEQTTSNAAFSYDQQLKMVKRWIRVAAMMYAQGNLNGVVCVVTVLQYADIRQIRAVWNSLEVIYQTAWSKLREIASPQHQFGAYWRETKYYSERPCVPFLGVYIEEITRFRDHCKPATQKSAKTINRDQMVALGHQLADLQRLQLTEFEIPFNAELQWQLNQQLLRPPKAGTGELELDHPSAEVTACRSWLV